MLLTHPDSITLGTGGLGMKTAQRMAEHKRWIGALKGDTPRLSFYRMIKGEAFAELCRFYEQGIGFRSFEQFAEQAAMLERTYSPNCCSSVAASPDSSII